MPARTSLASPTLLASRTLLAALTAVIAVTALPSCSGSAPDLPADAAIDATPDAPASTVLAVTCPATPAATVTASDGNDLTFMPKTTMITAGQIVRFDMPGTHNVAPLDTMSDPGMVVNFNQDRCLMFTRTGTFGFQCGSHGFVGAVIVQ